MPETRELRITFTVRDRFTPRLRIISRKLQVASWGIDWRACYGNLAEALRRIELRWPA